MSGDFFHGRHRTRGALLLIVLVLTTAFFYLALRQPGTVSAEGEQRELICQRLLVGAGEGRQALVASIWWAPLPTLLRLPLMYLTGEEDASGVPSVLVSVMGGVAVLCLTGLLLWRWTRSRISIAAPLILAVNPWFLHRCIDGSSAMPVVGFALMALWGVVEWTVARRLRGLALFGIGSALLLLSSLLMGLWVALLLALLLREEAVRGTSRVEREAALLLAATPLVYGLGLWVLANWLIMGDFLYFLRSLPRAWVLRNARMALAPDMLGVLAVMGVAPALLLARSIGARRRFCVDLGLASVSAFVAVAVLAVTGCLFRFSPEWLLTLVLGVLALVAWVAIGSPTHKRVAGWIAIPAILIASAFLDRTAKAPPTREDRSALLTEVERYVRPRSKYRRVLVCGYDSFGLLGSRWSPTFSHCIDPDIRQAPLEHPGFALFLLVHRPDGVASLDTVHRKYPTLYEWGEQGAVYAADFGDWRLFEIVTPLRASKAASPVRARGP